MNNYGNMGSTLQKVAKYQQVGCQWMPGYGDHYYQITVQEGSQTVSDVFHITNDGHLNHAINQLYLRAV